LPPPLVADVFHDEGESQAKIELAQAESLVLKTVSDAVQGEGSSLVDYNIAQKFNEFFREMGRNAESKTVYLPYQARVRTLQSLFCFRYP